MLVIFTGVLRGGIWRSMIMIPEESKGESERYKEVWTINILVSVKIVTGW